MGNNTAIVGKLVNIRPIEGADKIRLATVAVRGVAQANVVIGLEESENMPVVYFTSNMCVKPAMLDKYPDLGRYLGKAGRVRTIKLRGVISDGLIVSLDKFKVFEDFNADDGFEFTSIGTVEICARYEPPKAPEPMPKNKKKKEAVKKFHRLIDEQVRLHYDTDNFRRNAHMIDPNTIVSISRKRHGCVPWNTKITMADGTSKNIVDIVVGDMVAGFEEATKNIVPTKVVNTFNNGITNDWLSIKVKNMQSEKELKVTPNHKVFTQRGYIRAEDIVPGDTLYKSEYSCILTTQQKDAAIGKLLGDGSVGGNGGNRRIDYSHKIDHEEYVAYCDALFGMLAGTRAKSATSGYGTTMCRSKTKQHIAIDDFISKYSPVNENGRRPFKLNSAIVNDLSPLSIALWYMDDGSLNHNKTQYQRDRALIAVCAFNEQEVDWLVEGLAKFGITDVVKFKRKAYTGSKEYWRLRFNAEGAESLFTLIRPYVPPVMQYKLPPEHRGYFIGVTKENNTFGFYTTPVVVKSVIPYKPRNAKEMVKYDIETETHNYVANKHLVHNSSATVQHVLTKKVLNWKEKLAKFFGVPVVETAYDYIYTSRTVVKNANINLGKQNHFYGFDLWTDAGEKYFKGKLAKGESVYYEIVGYLPSGGAIQKGYPYGCAANTYAINVYRMTMTNPDGTVVEYGWKQLMERCAELDVGMVETYWIGTLRELSGLNDDYTPARIVDFLEKRYLGKPALDCNNRPDEGIVIRVDHVHQAEAYKLKDSAFIAGETAAFESGTVDIEENA
jgi:tRNA-binding EMAP/Myf-like protein